MQQERRYARIEPRGLVSKDAKLVIDLGQPALDCVILDLSAGGASVFVHGQRDVPDHVTLLHGGTKKPCCVVWRKGRRAGLQFRAHRR